VKKVPKKKAKTTEEHLQVIEFLLAGQLLERKPDIKQVAKVIGVGDDVITGMFPATIPKKRSKQAQDGSKHNIDGSQNAQ
jgi:hypothetical protein